MTPRSNAPLLHLALALLAAGSLRAQDPGVPRTRTLPGIEGPAFPYARPEEVGVSAEKLERLASEITEWVARGELVGAELLVVKDGRAIFHEAFGWADPEAGRPVERNSLWSIKSMSKPFTATAVLMLAEQGRLSLDDPVTRYLPGFAGDERTTIRDLLAHRSGYTGTSRLGSPAYGYGTLAEAVEDWAKEEPERPYGAFSYSDFNYGALGVVVEKVTGLGIDAFTEQRIIEPLGLDDTSTRFPGDAASASRVPPWYRWDDEGGRYELRWSNARQPWPYYAAAWGLFSTAMDYAEFLTLWMQEGIHGGTRLLTGNSVGSALRPHASRGTASYGLGWYVEEAPASDGLPAVFSHGGGDGALAIALPASDAMVIYLTHSRGGAHLDALPNRLGMFEIFDQPGIHHSQLVWAGDQNVPEAELTLAERAVYVGTYAASDPEAADGSGIGVTVREQGGRLHLRVGPAGRRTGDWFHLVPLGEHAFVPGQYHGERLDAVLPSADRGRVLFVVEDGVVTGLRFAAGDEIQLVAERVVEAEN